ncbi:hypothetical protein WA026_021118 [Henosepilachna vigintioctopunctata]|uniref:Uncharacterized protein n=1 Tax=Henosepilachna vigintioctopunctata TaxID=420089 RepID=A0AAW1V579_9CUCU
MKKKSCNKVTSSVLGCGAGPSREYSDRGTRQVSQACEEHTATDGKTNAKDLDKSKKDMNDKERTRSNTDSNGGNDRDMKKTEDVGMHATEIQNSNHRGTTECEDLNKIIIEVEDIKEDSFFADIITDNRNKRKRLYSSSPEEGEEKYRKTGMVISTEKIIEQFEKLEKFCEQNKNVYEPIKESVGMMRFTINRLRKGMENKESCYSEEKFESC